MPKFQVLLPQLWGKSRIYHRTFFLVLCLFLVLTALLELGKHQKRGWVSFWGTVPLHASQILRSDMQEEEVSNCFSKVWLSTVLTPHSRENWATFAKTKFFILHFRRIFCRLFSLFRKEVFCRLFFLFRLNKVLWWGLGFFSFVL